MIHSLPRRRGRLFRCAMPIDRSSHTFRVAAPAAEVFAHLVDPYSYIGLSPLVVEVRDVAKGPAEASYVAVERFGFGPLRWDNRIRVRMTWDAADNRIVSAVVSPGGVRLNSTVELSPDGADTTVRETIEVSSPALLRRFVIGKALSVQRDRAAELTRRMRA